MNQLGQGGGVVVPMAVNVSGFGSAHNMPYTLIPISFPSSKICRSEQFCITSKQVNLMWASSTPIKSIKYCHVSLQ